MSDSPIDYIDKKFKEYNDKAFESKEKRDWKMVDYYVEQIQSLMLARAVMNVYKNKK